MTIASPSHLSDQDVVQTDLFDQPDHRFNIFKNEPKSQELSHDQSTINNIREDQGLQINRSLQGKELFISNAFKKYCTPSDVEFLQRTRPTKQEMLKNINLWEEINQGNYSHYQELTILPEKIAKILCNKIDKKLSFPKLKRLSLNAAESFVAYKGFYLHFDGLVHLNINLAKILIQYHGMRLSFDGLRAINTNVAVILSQSQLALSLKGISYLSEEAREYFTVYQWDLGVTPDVRTQIDGLDLLAS